RSRMAPRLPMNIARRRNRSGRLCEAMAITTALSPDSTMLENMIFPTASQKAADQISTTAKSAMASSIIGISPNRPSSYRACIEPSFHFLCIVTLDEVQAKQQNRGGAFRSRTLGGPGVRLRDQCDCLSYGAFA